MKSFLSFLIVVLLISCKNDFQENHNNHIDYTDSWSYKDSKEFTNWYEGKPTDSLAGIDLIGAYEFLKNKTPKTDIIVALIDSPLDIYHEDLSYGIFVNQNEIPNNYIDDDGNGYVDDINGWNFLGLPNGTTISAGNFQCIRLIRSLQIKYGFSDLDSTKIVDSNDRKLFKELLEERESIIKYGQRTIEWATGLREKYYQAQELYGPVFVDYDFTQKIIENIEPMNEEETKILENIKYLSKYDFTLDDIDLFIDESYARKYITSNINYNPYDRIDSTQDQIIQKGYGHGNVSQNTRKKMHATQVAGVMMARRVNSVGVKGVTNNIRLMPLTIIPQGSARDKDFINAVRYAVDNGARIINYSAGDYYLEHKKEFYEAIEYAHNNNVLFVASAGNNGHNIDDPFYEYHPTGNSINGERLNTFLKVGAIDREVGHNLKYKNSNYGSKNVDVFAPGRFIKTTNASEYGYMVLGGTSLSASITTGVAAMILSYYPELTASEVKNILLSSSTKYNIPVTINESLVNFSELSRCGGVVNAFNALKKAEQISQSKLN